MSEVRNSFSKSFRKKRNLLTSIQSIYDFLEKSLTAENEKGFSKQKLCGKSKSQHTHTIHCFHHPEHTGKNPLINTMRNALDLRSSFITTLKFRESKKEKSENSLEISTFLPL